MKKSSLFILSSLVLLFSSCFSSSPLSSDFGTKGDVYGQLYQEKPTVVLVMPPINETSQVDAKEYMYCSLAKPLCERGYYVLPPLLTLDFLKNESAYDAENFIESDLSLFNKYLGADALLFTKIKKWSKSSLLATVTIKVSYVMRSARTNEVLFEREGTLVINHNSGNAGIGGLLSDMLSTALDKKINAAIKCNNVALKELPYGPYQKGYLQDKGLRAADYTFYSEFAY